MQTASLLGIDVSFAIGNSEDSSKISHHEYFDLLPPLSRLPKMPC